MIKQSLNNPSTDSNVQSDGYSRRDPMVIQGAIEACGHSLSGLSEAFDSLSASSLPETALAADAAISANGGAVFGLGAGAGVNEDDASVIPRMHSYSYSCARYLLKDHSDANANDAVAVANTDGAVSDVPAAVANAANVTSVTVGPPPPHF